MRPSLWGAMGLSPSYHPRPASASWPPRRVAADLRCERPRTRRFHPADGADLEGADAGHRRILVFQQLRIDRRHGVDPDRRHRGDHAARDKHDTKSRAYRGVTLMRNAAATPAIEVENLVIRYGSVTAVDSVSFVVNEGEQLTLLGPSGCGKTSTLRAVAGLERPHAGAIRIGGRAMYDAARGINLPAEQRGLSMVFQSYAIWPHMTVFENVAYGLRVRNESGASLKEKVHHALDLVQMVPFASRNASQLSGGQQQRVALARAFAFSPSVLLLDEPLSNL